MADREKPVVTFLGPKASYTHQATLDVFSPETYTLTPVTTIEDVFSSVQTGTAHRGVVPFENSSNGSVVFTLDLFADLNKKYPDILVTGESYISVQHCLLAHHVSSNPPSSSSSTKNLGGGTSTPPTHHSQSQGHHHASLSNIIESPLSSGTATPTTSNPYPSPSSKPPTTPLADLSRIQKLYSHPQAWGQCKTFLTTYLKGVERQDVSSTSRAAELVAQDKSGTSAAISSGIAAEIHGLDVLARGIEDRGDNTTRFFVIRKGARKSPEGSPRPNVSLQPAGGESTSWTITPTTTTFKLDPSSTNQVKPHNHNSDSENENENDNYKTLISFTIDHSNPGALAHSLAVFERYGLNLTSINTRPSGVENWNYIFFVEIKGRKLEGGEGNGDGGREDCKVERALGDLKDVCRWSRWLGSWENRLVR